MQRGADEEVVLACLLHDTVQELMRADHGYWGAQLYEPYVSQRVAFAIRYHQALRFYADTRAGYEYPALYYRMFGEDYVPRAVHPGGVRVLAQASLVRRRARGHGKRSLRLRSQSGRHARSVRDIIGRHFKQPREGLGNDDSPVAHMWRTLANPDAPL